MKTCKRVSLVAAFLLFVLTAHRASSQNQTATFSGKIIDAANGESLPGAAVSLRPGSRGALADQHGRFLIDRLPPGKYQVQVSMLGFARERDSLVIASGQTLYRHFALRQQALAFAEVTVTAERGHLTKEVNLSRELLDAQQLRTTSAIAEPDLFRSLALLPGVAPTNDFNSRFHVRGGQSNENHVLVEGVTIHNPYHALGFFSTFDVDAIKSVEVHRSIFPARYGERLSSVTNVILRDGNAQRFSGMGTISLATSKFLFEGPLLRYQPQSGRKWTFMLSGRRNYVDLILDYPLYFYDLSAKSVYDSGRKTRVTLHGFYGYDRLVDAEDPFPFPSVDFSDIRWNNRALGLHWQQFLSKQSMWSNRLSYSAFHSRANEVQFQYPRTWINSQQNNIRELSFNSEWQARLFEAGQGTFGYGFSRFTIDQYLNDFFRQVFQERWRKNDQHKIYASWEGGRGEHWIYNLGFTALYFPSIRARAVAPRLGAKYLWNDSWRLKAGFGRHYQFLSTINDDDDPVILFDAWLPTAESRPIARADHYGLGVEVGRSSACEADLEFYYHRYDHLTRYNRSQRPGEPFYLEGRGKSYGMELRVSYNLKNYYGFANYSLGWATSHFFLRNQPMRYANDFRWQSFPANGDVRHILNGVIGVRSGSKWDFNATFTYQSGRPYTAVLGSSENLIDAPFFWDPFSTLHGPLGHTTTDFIYSSKNALRYPFYQRVDLRAARNFDWLGMDWTFFAQIYNLFFRRNAAFHFPDLPFEHDKHPQALPIVPTFGISFRF